MGELHTRTEEQGLWSIGRDREKELITKPAASEMTRGTEDVEKGLERRVAKQKLGRMFGERELQRRRKGRGEQRRSGRDG